MLLEKFSGLAVHIKNPLSARQKEVSNFNDFKRF